MDSPRVEERLNAIESRLHQIESTLRILAPGVAPTPKQKASMVAASATATASQADPAREARPGNWLGVIAVVCFVLAAGFIIKLSIESGWLTPERQLGLAVLFGLGLIGAGFLLMKSDREYASLLPGGGVIVLYLSAFAAHRLYGLIPFETALAMTGLISVICIWLYTQIKHDLYALTAAVGAYIAPGILGFSVEAVFSLYYFLLCSVAFATISIWLRSRLLTAISAYLAIFMTGIVGMNLHMDQLVATMLALHFFIFSLGTYLYTRTTGQPLTQAEANGFLPVLLVFYALEYAFIDRINPDLAPWISLGFAGVLIGLYLAAKPYFKDGHSGSQSLIIAFTTIVCFHSVYLELLPMDARPWLFALIMLAIAFSPFSLPARQENGLLFRLPVIALFTVAAIEYLNMVSHLLNRHHYSDYWLLVSAAAFASIWVALLAGDGNKRAPFANALLGSAHILALLGFYRLTHDISSLAVSASWLAYAVAVIVFAFTRKDEVMARSALFVLSFAAGKALLYDAASAPTIIRILCLLLTGAVLYGCGLIIRKMARWEK